MSPDVSLYVEGSNGTGTGIFIRKWPCIREITLLNGMKTPQPRTS